MTETSTHLQEIALEKAMVQSADEAAAWPTTPLARFALALCNELELKSDELAGITPCIGEEAAKREISLTINDALTALANDLAEMRSASIYEAEAGYRDADYSERLHLETSTVSEALAKMRKEARAEPILSPHHTSTGIWL